MHRLIIRAIGKPHEPWHPQAIHSLLKRLTPFAIVDMIELPEAKTADPIRAMQDETDRLLKSIPPNAMVVILDRIGKNFTSDELADALRGWTDRGRTAVFLIGGSHGLDHNRFASRKITTASFGKQTLPHILARIVLLEQLYRSETIIAGKSYHK